MISRTMKFGAITASTLLLVGGVAACSSSKSGGSTTSSAAAGGSSAAADASSSAATPTGTPIKIMVTGTLSSPILSYPQQEVGANAAAKAVNAAGGVNGHPIVIETCNDSLDPNKALQCAQKAVDDKVVALVGGIEEFSAQMWPTLQKANIPWVASIVINGDQGTNALSFPLSGGIPSAFNESGRLAVQKGGKKVVIFVHENSQSTYTADNIEAGVKAEGGTVIKRVLDKLGNTDVTSQVQQALAAKPDAIACACNQGDAARLLQGVYSAGFKGPFAGSISSFTTNDIKTLGPAANQIVAGADLVGPDLPAAAQWVSEMNAVDPSAQKDNISGGAWLGVHVIANELKGQSDLTSANLVHELNTSPSISVLGMSGDTITFTKAGPYPSAPRIVNSIAYAYAIKGGAFAGSPTPVDTAN